MVASKQFALNTVDLKNWAKNAIIFAAPALLVLLSSFRNIVPADASWAVVALYVLNVATDILRKYVSGSK